MPHGTAEQAVREGIVSETSEFDGSATLARPSGLPAGLDGFSLIQRATLRRRALHALQAFLHCSGAAALYVWSRRIRGATILMYHSVSADEEVAWIDPRNRISSRHFEVQMHYLHRHRRVISMTALAEVLERDGGLPAGTVVLTFDDGYRDNLHVAAPILKRYGLPATLYLTTGYIERGETQWVDQLYTAFRCRTQQELHLPGEAALRFDLQSPHQARAAYRAVADHLLVAPYAARQELLHEVKDQLRPWARPPRLTMLWEEACQLQREYPHVEIGVHTRDHIDLTSQPNAVVRREVEGCVADVERELGYHPTHFSFPYSRWNEVSSQAVRDAGLRSAVAEGSDCLVRPGSDLYALPRIAAPESLTRLAFMTSGAFPALPLALTGRA